MSKPVVGLDCDGILANFVKTTLEFVELEGGGKWREEDVKTWDIFRSIPDETGTLERRVYDRIKAPGGCFAIQPYVGAVEGVAALREHVEVVIVTAPFKGAQTWVDEREKWLEKYFKVHHHDILHVRRKEFVAVDVFMDDKPEHVDAWTAAFPHRVGLLWDQPYNRAVGHCARIRSWQSLLELVRYVTR